MKDIEYARSLIKEIENYGFFNESYLIKYHDSTPDYVHLINCSHDAELMIKILLQGTLKHWEDHNIPPIPEDASFEEIPEGFNRTFRKNFNDILVTDRPQKPWSYTGTWCPECLTPMIENSKYIECGSYFCEYIEKVK